LFEFIFPFLRYNVLHIIMTRIFYTRKNILCILVLIKKVLIFNTFKQIILHNNNKKNQFIQKKLTQFDSSVNFVLINSLN